MDLQHSQGSIEAPFLSTSIQTALIMADTQVLQGHFTQLGTFLSKTDYSDPPHASLSQQQTLH